MNLFEHFFKVMSLYLEARVWIWIRIRIKVKGGSDPHQSDKQDPDPHQNDADPQYWLDY
jgi:hypothetical protein